MRTIQYGIDTQTGLIVSRVNDQVAWPILDYENMKPENNFSPSYYLEKIPIFSIANLTWNSIKWTRKISIKIKNKHRAFWKFKPLKDKEA